MEKCDNDGYFGKQWQSGTRKLVDIQSWTRKLVAIHN